MGGTVSHHSSNSYCPRDGVASSGELAKPTENGRRHRAAEDKEPEARVAFELFLRGCRLANAGAGPCLGTRDSATAPYAYKSYKETLEQIGSVSRYLTSVAGLQKGDFVGTLSSNCAELAVLELACYSSGLVIVPLYDTLGQEACGHILSETGLRLVFCRSAKQLSSVKSLLLASGDDGEAACRVTRAIVAEPEGCESSDGVQVDSFADVLASAANGAEEEGEGKKKNDPAVEVEPSDLAVVCYTSGTTGQPKGVMLTNSNLVRGVHLVRQTIMEDTYRHSLELHSGDVYFSYLPMAHILERMCQLFSLAHGASVGFFRGDRTRLMEDLRECRPTFLATVPKVLSRIRERTLAAVSGSRMKSAVLSAALDRKGRLVSDMRLVRDTVWDRLVFRKVQDGLGGRVRFVAVGGAPISPETLHFVKVALGCPVLQGFGQTETSGLGLCQRPGDPTSDNTGQPMLGVEVKLVDAPDADCLDAATTGRGELCIRGPTCFAGYYKQPERTAEALDSDGWVHTGDIALALPTGAYRIVDRVKHLFKLAQGEYIAPEKIELVYGLCPMVEQVFVDGRSQQSFLLGVVVPTADAAGSFAGPRSDGQGGQASSTAKDTVARACESAEFKAQVLAAMQQLGKSKGLQGFEQVKDIALHPHPFTAENDLLTPTMKMKRPQLRKKFSPDFDRMYSLLEG